MIRLTFYVYSNDVAQGAFHQSAGKARVAHLLHITSLVRRRTTCSVYILTSSTRQFRCDHSRRRLSVSVVLVLPPAIIFPTCSPTFVSDHFTVSILKITVDNQLLLGRRTVRLTPVSANGVGVIRLDERSWLGCYPNVLCYLVQCLRVSAVHCERVRSYSRVTI